MIIICPRGGLANRMRVLAWALSLANEAGTNVLCRWISNHELGASFENLFQPIDNLKVTGEATFHPRSADSCKGFKRFRNRLWNKLLGIDECFKESDIDKYVPEGNSEEYKSFHDLILGYLRKNRNVYVETCSLLSDKCKVDMFKPEMLLQKQIDEFSHLFSDKTYGIHIRRTDNTWAIENSPLELFVKKIDEIISDDSASKFYLATDDAETINVLKGRFGDRILVREKDFSRATESGIQDAVVDIWLLSKTRKIYGSFYSSFSEMAAWIGGIELEIQKSKQ
ncbi:MAG: hypothetical protein Q4F69_00200 [Bacteroidia bacterium]|nr:hypothetical protein [Bacteroidia bacterium]